MIVANRRAAAQKRRPRRPRDCLAPPDAPDFAHGTRRARATTRQPKRSGRAQPGTKQRGRAIARSAIHRRESECSLCWVR